MSLESNLELNNKLLTRQNELAEQQNTLLAQLVSAFSSGKTFTADTPHQPKAETPVDKSATAKEARRGPFYAKHNGTEIAFRVDTRDEFEKANSDSPYGGITEIHKVEFLQLREHRAQTEVKPVALEDQPLPGITERRAYADLLLDTPKEKRADVKPAKPKASAKGKNTETVTTTAGAEAPDATALLDKGKQLIIQKIAPKAPADLRKTLDLFGLKKLTDCPEEKLPDVVAALEQLAESLEA